MTTQGLHVLVVDDNAMNRKMLSMVLKTMGITTEEADGGAACLELVSQKKYDVIFMDHLMPEMDGVEATQEIRKLDIPYCKEVPIVALTANAVYGARKELLESGFCDYVAKPIDVKQFEMVLRKYLSNISESEITEWVEQESSISIKGIDAASAMDKMHLGEEDYLNILRAYHVDLPNSMKRIITAKKNGDIKSFVIDVHGVKSASASVGAMKLSELAKQLEFAGKEDSLEFIETHITEFVDVCEEIMEALDAFFKTDKTIAEEKEFSVLDKQWLSDISLACDDMDASKASELLEQVQDKCFSEEEEELLQKIKEYVNQYDYDEVVSMLQEWLSKEEYE